MKILVLAAHPDDEVLGMGATIKKLSKKNKVVLCVVSEGSSSQYKDKKMIQVRRNACEKSSRILGITKTYFLDFPDMKLDTIPHVEINKKIEQIIQKENPSIVYTTPPNDINKDHQKVYESTLVISRPYISKIKQVFCYEIPNTVKKPFQPNVYENIEKEFSFKIKAFKQYESEIGSFPHPRSLESIENLAIQRGVESGLKKAEAFQLIRQIN